MSRLSSKATAASMSELSTASRRPLLPRESQLKAAGSRSSCPDSTRWMVRRTTVSIREEWTAITLLEASPRRVKSRNVTGNRRARRWSSSREPARRSCWWSETPAVVGDTRKSRAVTMPRSSPTGSSTITWSASRSSMVIIASADDVPTGTQGWSWSARAAALTAGAPEATQLRMPASVSTANRCPIDRDRRTARSAHGHGGSRLRHVEVGPDHQGRAFDQVLDQRVRRIRTFTHRRDDLVRCGRPIGHRTDSSSAHSLRLAPAPAPHWPCLTSEVDGVHSGPQACTLLS